MPDPSSVRPASWAAAPRDRGSGVRPESASGLQEITLLSLSRLVVLGWRLSERTSLVEGWEQHPASTF